MSQHHHHHHHQSASDTGAPAAGDLREMFTREFWDERYAASTRVWSGNPNQRLVEQARDLTPGTALDVGCGEGGDAIWLARQGWRVLGVDLSAVATERAAAHAEEAGVADRADFRAVDLRAGHPLPGDNDLVSAAFLHVPPADFDAVYSAIAAAVAPGGTLLVLGHHSDDADAGVRPEEFRDFLFTPERVLAALDRDNWDVQVAEGQTRQTLSHESQEQVLATDTVVRAVRRA